MRPGTVAASVEDYLAACPPPERAALKALRRAILAAAPKAQELISYRMPAYKLNGPLLFFACMPTHLSLYAVSRPLLKRFAKELSAFEVKGTTIHFSAEHPLPTALVKKIVKARQAQNLQRVAPKQA